MELAKGQTTADIARKLGITEQTYYRWRQEYNTFRSHSALGYQPPAPEAMLWLIPNRVGFPSAATAGLT